MDTRKYISLLLLGTGIFSLGCRNSHLAGNPVNLNPKAVAPDLGSGRYLYQFVLKDRDGDPEPNTPFALSTQGTHQNLSFVEDEKKVYQGMTDASGRTPVIALPSRVSSQHWRLRERVGSGPFGEDFLLSDSKNRPTPGVAYTLVVCENPARHYSGYSNQVGYSAYSATTKPVSVLIFTGDDDDAVAANDDGADQQAKSACEEDAKKH